MNFSRTLFTWSIALGSSFLSMASSAGAAAEGPLDSEPSASRLGRLSAPLAEDKLYKLFKGYDSSNSFEASGVYALGDYYYVVFDNLQKLGKVHTSLPQNSSKNTLTSGKSSSSGYEGITYDDYSTPNFYVVTEGESHNGSYAGNIRQYSSSLSYQSSMWADFSFASANKGFEGISWLRRGGEDYLLALCEGNFCLSDDEADRGNGRLEVLKQTSSGWAWVAEIIIPAAADFLDYSDIDLDGTRLAIVSQKSAALWIGELSATSWEILGEGAAYDLPRGDSSGTVGAGEEVIYCNIEGVSWISPSRVVMVSDMAKSGDPAACLAKDQSIHVFDVP